MMKIAVTYEDGQVFQHFGHCGEFKIYETEKDTVIIPFSAQTKQGREEIYDVIDSLLAGEE